MSGICARLWGKTGVRGHCKTTGSKQIASTYQSQPGADQGHVDSSSFITRNDIVDMRAAGLNSLRIPVGYWSVDLLEYEPYVSGQVSRRHAIAKISTPT